MSLGGQFVLVKVVIKSIPVFWMVVAIIPTSVINKIRKLMFNFFWSGSRKGAHSPLQMGKHRQIKILWRLGCQEFVYVK